MASGLAPVSCSEALEGFLAVVVEAAPVSDLESDFLSDLLSFLSDFLSDFFSSFLSDLSESFLLGLLSLVSVLVYTVVLVIGL